LPKGEELMAWDRVLKRADEQITRFNNDKDRMSDDYKEQRADLARIMETLEEEASIRDEQIRCLRKSWRRTTALMEQRVVRC
jgi:hypothetical protein